MPITCAYSTYIGGPGKFEIAEYLDLVQLMAKNFP